MLEWFNFTYLFLSFTHLTGAVYLLLGSTLELATKAEGSQNELKLSEWRVGEPVRQAPQEFFAPKPRNSGNRNGEGEEQDTLHQETRV